MALIQIIPQGGTPETATTTQLLIFDEDLNYGLEVEAGIVTIGKTEVTYTATTGTVPTDDELFELWAPVINAAYRATGPPTIAPVVRASNGNIIYPAGLT